MNGVRTTDHKFATKRQLDRLEQEIINLQRSVEAQSTIIVNLRDQVEPPLVEVGRPQRSPVVRNAVGLST